VESQVIADNLHAIFMMNFLVARQHERSVLSPEDQHYLGMMPASKSDSASGS